ncbi:AAA family ATPase [Haliangium sp.]|uniref:AAA family ATPase n=1 Tax=Haliangium sp. TaxID=2663208 RepID=UPI003D1411DE
MDTNRPFNVFYGRNGVGKSNILAGLQALLDVLAKLLEQSDSLLPLVQVPISDVVPHAIRPDDRCAIGTTYETRLGATFETTTRSPELVAVDAVEVEVCIDWMSERVTLTRCRVNDDDDLTVRPLQLADEVVHRYGALFRWLCREAFALVSADRIPRYELEANTDIDDGADAEPLLAELLQSGQLKRALLAASQDPNPTIRRRYRELQALLQGEPLCRPPFDMTLDRRTGAIELRERLDDHGDADIPFDLLGLGVAQVYSMLAQIMLSRAGAVGIEEPEAHLHAPTTGRDLRVLLQRLVDDGYLAQLFIATHSNLFDLDPDGYWDVRLDPADCTTTERKPLAEIDLWHLYEPGPGKHALIDFLRIMGDEDVGLRLQDGTPVTTSKMIEMLQRGDAIAVEFLRELHSAATRLAMLRQRKRHEGEK